MRAIAVRARTASSADAAAVRSLVFAERSAEMLAVGVQPTLVDLILAHQYAAWERSRAAYPGLADTMLFVDEEPVGCLSVAELGADWQVVDIVVTAARRRQGIARSALTGLLAHTDAAGGAVCVEVAPDNLPARELALSLGFSVVEESPRLVLRRPARGLS